MRNPFPLDRGAIDSLGHWRPTFDYEDLVSSGRPWRGFLVTEAGMLGVTPEPRLWSVGRSGIAGDLAPVDLPGSAPWLMGSTGDGVIQLAWSISTAQAELYPAVFLPLTDVGADLDADDSLLAAQAVALARWHDLGRFCARCGSSVETVEAGWATRCRACQNVEYPRSDPAVIVRITDDRGRLLLAHNSAWTGNRMSLPAGFVEAGETPRRAVEREIFEEVGLRVTDIEYLGAQPWPGPRSLMLAFSARARGVDVLPVVDLREIDRARFFAREEYAAALESGDVTAPGPAAIAHTIIAEWLGRPLPTGAYASARQYLSGQSGQ